MILEDLKKEDVLNILRRLVYLKDAGVKLNYGISTHKPVSFSSCFDFEILESDMKIIKETSEQIWESCHICYDVALKFSE